MSGIKRTPADAAYSDCIRERANWSCQRCMKYYPEGRRAGLHCSHHYRRGNWGVRFHPLNAEALCYGCHSHYGGTEERMREVMTEFDFDILRDMKNDTSLGKLYRKTKGVGKIAKHYRDEHKRMADIARGCGLHIDFEAFY